MYDWLVSPEIGVLLFPQSNHWYVTPVAFAVIVSLVTVVVKSSGAVIVKFKVTIESLPT